MVGCLESLFRKRKKGWKGDTEEVEKRGVERVEVLQNLYLMLWVATPRVAVTMHGAL